MRVKGGYTNRRRHKKVLKRVKGFYSANSRCYVHAVEKLDRALAYAYRDRRVKKRDFRALWNQRINAAAREHGTTYSRLIGGLNKAGIALDRKMLAHLAMHDPNGFAQLCRYALPS
ncbi:MAG: 50S ribosomal protein L20 [Bdellovibrionaceae bacterium]|nr:50S ribosomal protein L20 [Pseudobdellovibrionaceae bacterium]MDW8190715.1 50S ribosomal protein L20 [Pseudobdellovibrionaceae bacterium]